MYLYLSGSPDAVVFMLVGWAKPRFRLVLHSQLGIRG